MTIGEMLGLSELSERFFGEGMEGLEKRRQCCAWLSLPAAIGSFLVIVAGLIFLFALGFINNPTVFVLLSLPTAAIVTLISYWAVLIGSRGLDCASNIGRLVSATGLFGSLIVFLFSLLGLVVSMALFAGEVLRLMLAGFEALM